VTKETIERMLDNLSEFKSSTETDDLHSKYKISGETVSVSPDEQCPEVAVVNISQDHWLTCKNGPVNKNSKYHTWTAIPRSRPSSLSTGSILIVRRTSTTNNLQSHTSESKTNGVMGIWVLDQFERVHSNNNHSWNSSYEWYLHCTSIETRPEVVYKEDWSVVDIEPNTMQGQAVFTLTKQQQKNYLGELLLSARLSQATKQFLGSLVACKSS